jgi:TRAP transporter TAXI family solute receptor
MRQALRNLIVALSMTMGATVVWAQPAPAPDPALQNTIDVGQTGFANKRPVFASACPFGCPWGELGEFVQAAMKPMGYDLQLCRNCNRAEGPRLVSKASLPPPLVINDIQHGTTSRLNAPVDFGVTESGMLAWAYEGRSLYAKDGPYKNLRLIAKIEDPTYLLVGVRADSPITDLAQIKDKKMKVTILSDGLPTTTPVLEHYGLTKEAVESWGGRIVSVFAREKDLKVDVIVSSLASPSNNPESVFWQEHAWKTSLRFLQLPDALLDKFTTDEFGMERVTAYWGLIHGLDRNIPTVARSGEAVFGRDDMPEQVAYDAAKAIDESQAMLKWYIRPYSYNPRTAWKNYTVPLHPGAERYYREMGYMK